MRLSTWSFFALSAGAAVLLAACSSHQQPVVASLAPLTPPSPDPTLRQLEAGRTAIEVLTFRRDIAAGNLANSLTPGYRALRATQAPIVPGPGHAGGVRIAGTYFDNEQGAPVKGTSLDLMIDGAGFFRVELDDDVSPAGIAYTRAGRFTINPEGEIVTIDGGRRLHPTLVVPGDTMAIGVDSAGDVYFFLPGTPEPQLAGRLELATFLAPEFLAAAPSGLFVETPRSGPPTLGDPATENRGRILQGYYESSNVSPEQEALELRIVERALALWGVAGEPLPPLVTAESAAP